MDTTALVNEAKLLVQLLDDAGHPPKGAMLVENAETNIWRLWIVPPESLSDKLEFFALISSLIIRNQESFSLIDSGDVDFRPSSQFVVQALSKVIRIDGMGVAHFSGNAYNGFPLPNGIILRMSL